MKYVKFALLALLLIVSYGTIYGQDKENLWMLTLGANTIDFIGGNSDYSIGSKISI